MINIDTRFLAKVDESELWLLLHILDKTNAKMECFPSNETLCNETEWDIKKLQRVKARLIEKKILVVKVRAKKGRQTSNLYRIDTDLLAIYVPAKTLQFEGTLETDTTPMSEGDTTTPPEMGQRSITHNEALPKGSIKAAPTLSKEEREKKFGLQIAGFTKKYSAEMLRAFFDYWREWNDGETKMKWEINKSRGGTFNIGLRLSTWKKREDYSRMKNGQNAELKTTVSNPETYHTTPVH